MLFNVVPVGLLHAAATRADTADRAARTVGALHMGRGVVVEEDALGLEVGKLRIAGIAEEERFPPIADEHERILRNLQLGHRGLS